MVTQYIESTPKDLKRHGELKSSSVASGHGSMTRTQKKCFLVLITVRGTNILYGCPRVIRTGLKAKKSLLSKHVRLKQFYSTPQRPFL